MSKQKYEHHNFVMHYFFISISALLVTTKSPKDCEDDYFTGYLISLSMFTTFTFLYFMCFAVIKG